MDVTLSGIPETDPTLFISLMCVFSPPAHTQKHHSDGLGERRPEFAVFVFLSIGHTVEMYRNSVEMRRLFCFCGCVDVLPSVRCAVFICQTCNVVYFTNSHWFHINRTCPSLFYYVRVL